MTAMAFLLALIWSCLRGGFDGSVKLINQHFEWHRKYGDTRRVNAQEKKESLRGFDGPVIQAPRPPWPPGSELHHHTLILGEKKEKE
jgi:hypothetical protein